MTHTPHTLGKISQTDPFPGQAHVQYTIPSIGATPLVKTILFLHISSEHCAAFLKANCRLEDWVFKHEICLYLSKNNAEEQLIANN